MLVLFSSYIWKAEENNVVLGRGYMCDIFARIGNTTLIFMLQRL